jgi:hypothetical protein
MEGNLLLISHIGEQLSHTRYPPKKSCQRRGGSPSELIAPDGASVGHLPVPASQK